MDGVIKAEIKQGSDTELVDMMDWNTDIDNTPLSSSFKIVWHLKDKEKIPF